MILIVPYISRSCLPRSITPTIILVTLPPFCSFAPFSCSVPAPIQSTPSRQRERHQQQQKKLHLKRSSPSHNKHIRQVQRPPNDRFRDVFARVLCCCKLFPQGRVSMCALRDPCEHYPKARLAARKKSMTRVENVFDTSTFLLVLRQKTSTIGILHQSRFYARARITGLYTEVMLLDKSIHRSGWLARVPSLGSCAFSLERVYCRTDEQIVHDLLGVGASPVVVVELSTF